MQKTKYQIISQNDSKKLAQFLCKEGRLLLPMVELITQAEMAIDELIEVTGRAAIEAVLTDGVSSLIARRLAVVPDQLQWYNFQLPARWYTFAPPFTRFLLTTYNPSYTLFIGHKVLSD